MVGKRLPFDHDLIITPHQNVDVLLVACHVAVILQQLKTFHFLLGRIRKIVIKPPQRHYGVELWQGCFVLLYSIYYLLFIICYFCYFFVKGGLEFEFVIWIFGSLDRN